jgi:hypothetical protein
MLHAPVWKVYSTLPCLYLYGNRALSLLRVLSSLAAPLAPNLTREFVNISPDALLIRPAEVADLVQRGSKAF